MLIFNRKLGEKVMIGDDIEVVVLEVREGSVRLGFEAPRRLSVHRQEVWERIRQEGETRPHDEEPGADLRRRPA